MCHQSLITRRGKEDDEEKRATRTFAKKKKRLNGLFIATTLQKSGVEDDLQHRLFGGCVFF